MGLNPLCGNNQGPVTSSASDVIVGVIDGGSWPESESFSDTGLGAVPIKFKGECVAGENFTSDNCNWFYFKGFEAENGPLEDIGGTFFRSARDSDGHGSHTSSTIAGAILPNVSLSGMARGTARGGASYARLAIYKACWFNLCSDADVVSAMDDAINDGVDILSLSLALDPPQPIYFTNAISVGAFHAFKKGIVVSCSAGNSFSPKTAANVAPWILTVAASSLDREFGSNIYLGNSQVLKVIFTNAIMIFISDFLKIDVLSGTINTVDPAKIVVCTIEVLTDVRRQKAVAEQLGEGAGMKLIDPIVKEVGFQFVIPGTLIGQEEAQQLQAYMQTQRVLNTKPAPKVTVFSSQGPNVITPGIIKPDITAPGLNILAAWSSISTVGTGGRRVNYNIISGTSMSCPHVSAAAAILKSYRPSWSPAAIKSAIMTTATPFDFGSGHINPLAALNPGLIYRFDSSDVIDFLCSIGARPAQLKILTGQTTYCQNPTKQSSDFNNPSIGVSNMKGSIPVYRTVTYYGTGPTAYVVKADDPAGVQVTVTPAQLKFTKTGENMSFRIDFKPLKTSDGNFVFGALTWSNGVHKVRRPIALQVLSL
ncbi:hypothetical protein POPTR_004G184600v4 [Populus trichocarpa]|uniref:Uncharacterized protein n=1 Tax=Populus trichocarpa TaxID=3694 RepID=A0ACC0T5H6_POPTR|nr:hypothetical protein POPTR_004G184600v4 [Populus trichocarpa]